jgi:hypothetical protein
MPLHRIADKVDHNLLDLLQPAMVLQFKTIFLQFHREVPRKKKKMVKDE